MYWYWSFTSWSFYTWGIYKGGKETKNLKDFFIAGGKWGPLVSFIFVFASAIAGNEAVVVAKGGYTGGLSGVWYWWSFLFATPIYFLFSTYFKRARVYNLAEFLEMRFGRPLASFYSLIAGILCVLHIGMFLLAIGKILAGMIAFHPDFSTNVTICIWSISLIVGAYVGTGGMMSALLTDILQGLMCLFILGFIGLPFLWIEIGGFESLQGVTQGNMGHVIGIHDHDYHSGAECGGIDRGNSGPLDLQLDLQSARTKKPPLKPDGVISGSGSLPWFLLSTAFCS